MKNRMRKDFHITGVADSSYETNLRLAKATGIYTSTTGWKLRKLLEIGCIDFWKEVAGMLASTEKVEKGFNQTTQLLLTD